jgi:stage IV sporulation protein FB
MLSFTIFRIPVGIHWMFFVLIAFLGGALRASTPQQWQYVLLFMAAAFISILIHELGHALTGIKKGAPQSQIQLHGLGGTASFGSTRFSRTDSIIVTAAGPAASIGLAVLSFVVLTFIQTSGGPASALQLTLAQFFSIMLMINIFWTIFNILPILPLDGGQIVREALGHQRLKITCIISFVTLAFAGLALFALTRSFFNLIIIALLGMHTFQVWKSIR